MCVFSLMTAKRHAVACILSVREPLQNAFRTFLCERGRNIHERCSQSTGQTCKRINSCLHPGTAQYEWSVPAHVLSAASCSDNTLKWTPDRPHSIHSLAAHPSCIYQASFSPHTPSVFASCSTDGTLKIFDLRSPSPSIPGPVHIPKNSYAPPPLPLAQPALTVPAHGPEVLSLDWNKYRPWVLATAGVDKLVKVWDCRMVKIPPPGTPATPEVAIPTQVGANCEAELRGHEFAVRKVQWSPHRADILATASYDMTCRVYVAFFFFSYSRIFAEDLSIQMDD
jgi:WD40 repeat protein